MLNWMPRRVKFVRAATARSVPPVVQVMLERRGEPYVGLTPEAAAGTDDLRRSGEATPEALRKVIGPETKLTLKSVAPTVALEQGFMLAVVEVQHRRRTCQLLGACPLSLDPVRDSALAVLDATNRFLGLA